jgi:hypothetical protein
MSADRAAEMNAEEPKITIEDVKHRAQAVRDLATSEAKRAAAELMHEKVTQTIIAGVVIVTALTSLAFFIGTRKGRSSCPPSLPPGWPPQ